MDNETMDRNGTSGTFAVNRELEIVTWDEWVARATRISAETARGRALGALFPELETRGLLVRFRHVLETGAVQVLAPALHHYLLACPPLTPARHFDKMQQRVTLAPLGTTGQIVGVIVTLEDVTARLEQERELAAQLNDPDENTRLHAAEAFQRDPTIDPAPLTRALGDASWRVRRAVVNTLAGRADPQITATLVEAVRTEHRDLSVLNSALQALNLSGLDARAPLCDLLRAPNHELRTYAALALGEHHDPHAIPALLDALDDADANVRYHVVEALGKLRARAAVERLTQLAEARDFFLSFPALDALARIGDESCAPRLVPLLADELLAAPASEALSGLGNAASVEPLAALLNQPNAPTAVIVRSLVVLYDRYEKTFREGALVADLARRAVNATGKQNVLDALADARGEDLRAFAIVLGWLQGDAVARALTRLLGEPGARQAVIEALVRHGAGVSELLIEQLDAPELETREAAVIALGRIGATDAVPALTQRLDDDPELVVVITGALARIGDRRAFDALLGLLGHPNAAVRQSAIAALNSLGHPAMPARAAVLLNDPNPRVRESAARIAGYFGFPQCVEQLLVCCNDADENVRRAAIENMPYLQDPRARVALTAALAHDSPVVRAAAARAFAFVNMPEALSPLAGALKDEDFWVRFFAARSLGRHGSPEALDGLAQLAQNDPVPPVRAAALEALGQIGGARAVAIIAPFAESDDRDLYSAGLAALGHINHPNALPPLLAALRSPEPARRLDAVRALGGRGGAGAAGALQWAAVADEDPQVAQAAVEALGQVNSSEGFAALVALASHPARREECIAALAQARDEQLPWLARGLQHHDPAARQAVVDALARIKRPLASEHLLAALDNPVASVRLAAIRALAHLDLRRAERQLALLARSDPDAQVRRAGDFPKDLTDLTDLTGF